jgi:hypothetical protein
MVRRGDVPKPGTRPCFAGDNPPSPLHRRRLDADPNVCSCRVPLHRHRARGRASVARPGTSHGSVTLPDGTSFFEWAQKNWPAPRWSVQLDPWQLAPNRS